MTPEAEDVPPSDPTGPSQEDLADPTAWIDPDVIVGDSFEGSTITHADGTVTYYRVPTREELEAVELPPEAIAKLREHGLPVPGED